MTQPTFSCCRRSHWDYAALVTVFLLSLIVVISLVDHFSQPKVNNKTVTTFDLNRYLGEWYELARFDHRFERGMTHNVTEYSIRSDGLVSVKNEGLKDGEWKTKYAKAKLTATPGLLEISYWGPFYSDYRVLMVDPGYSYALVGGGNGDLLWILSRTRTLPDDILRMLIAEAERRGYDSSRLIWVDQTTPF